MQLSGGQHYSALSPKKSDWYESFMQGYCEIAWNIFPMPKDIFTILVELATLLTMPPFYFCTFLLPPAGRKNEVHLCERSVKKYS